MLELSLLQLTPAYLVAMVMFILIAICYTMGNRERMKAIKHNPDEALLDIETVNMMLLGLLGLLLAFTFSMANSRFDTRRNLIIEEANAIGTAILRTDVYPDSVRQLLRANLKEYVEARIAFYEVGNDVEKIIEQQKKSDQISKKVWFIATTYAKKDNSATIASQLIPALNAMIDITTTRRAAGEATIPDSILYFLFILCLGSAFLMGYASINKMDWIVVFGFAAMLSVTIFTIIDLDRSRSGLITMDRPNQRIVELRELFK